MRSISTLNMTREAWLKARQQGIGGSDVAAILGFSKYKTPLDVYNEKIATEPIDQQPNSRMIAGLKLEDTIADWWSTEYNFPVRRDNKIRFHQKHDFLLANIDRQIVSPNGRGTGILEVKCTNKFSYAEWEEHGFPLWFHAQVQHYFNVTGYRWGAVAILVDGWNLNSIDLEPDPEFIEAMTERLKIFWMDHVLKKIPPEPSTDEEVKRIYPHHEPEKELEATEETLQLVKEIVEVERERKEQEAREKELKTQLKVVMKTAEQLTYHEQILATFRSSKQYTYFDKSRLEQEHPDIYNDYVIIKPGSRTLLIKKFN